MRMVRRFLDITSPSCSPQNINPERWAPGLSDSDPLFTAASPFRKGSPRSCAIAVLSRQGRKASETPPPSPLRQSALPRALTTALGAKYGRALKREREREFGEGEQVKQPPQVGESKWGGGGLLGEGLTGLRGAALPCRPRGCRGGGFLHPDLGGLKSGEGEIHIGDRGVARRA